MRVIFIQDIGDVGGATKSLVELIDNLNKNYGIDPIVLTSEQNYVNSFCDEKGYENYSINHKPVIVHFPNSKIKNWLKHRLSFFIFLVHYIHNLKSLAYISRKIDFKTIDLIHTNVNRDSIGFMISKKYKIKHIVHLREFGDLDYDCYPLYSKYIDYMNRYSDSFIAISEIVRKHWIKKGLDAEKIKVIYNGIPLQTKYKTKKNNNIVNCIFSGNISKNKGQIQLINAISNLDNDDKAKIRLDIYGLGDDGYVNELKQIVVNNKLDKIICFKGLSHDLNKVMNKYDIGFVCSKAEAFGRVTVEYMLSKILVIASNTGANTELIKDYENGLLYEYNDIENLSEKMHYAINNYKNMEKIIQNAYNIAVNNYTSNINAKNIYELYLNIININ